MRTRTPICFLIVTTLVALSAACGGEDPPAKSPSSVTSKESATSDEKKSDDTKKSAGDDTKKNSASGKSELSCNGKPEVGKSASTFSLSPFNGGNKIGIEKGKVTIVDFWATWCEPCKKSFPKYQELFVKYKASGLDIVAVSVDEETKKEIPSFVKAHNAKFSVVWDEGHKVADCYQPPTMPSAYVIDKNGIVKFIHIGYRDGEEKELEKEIKSLL